MKKAKQAKAATATNDNLNALDKEIQTVKDRVNADKAILVGLRQRKQQFKDALAKGKQAADK